MQRLEESPPHCAVANVLNCNILVREFEIQLHYYTHFWCNTLGKDMNLFNFYGLNSTTAVLLKVGFGIK